MVKKTLKNKKTENGKMIINELARTMANGFLEIDEKFDKIDEKFDKIDEKFDKIDEKFNRVEERIDKVETAVLDLRITMDRRLNSMEEKIGKGVDRMLTIADGMTSQFLTWKQENAFGAGIEARQDDELKDHEKRIVKIEQKIGV